MWHDFFTVFWKEMTVLRRIYRKPSSFIITGICVLFFGVFPAFFLGADFVNSPLTLFYLTIAPLVIGTGIATLAFAGEREAHTLETLFASRLDDLAIVLGKIIAYTVYAWLYVLLCILSGWITTVLIVGRIVAYNLQILVGGLLIGFGVAFFAAAVGALASLRAGTIKEARRKLTALYLIVAIPYFALKLMPETAHSDLMAGLSNSNTWLIVAVVVIFLLVLDTGLLIAIVRRFKRRKMRLD